MKNIFMRYFFHAQKESGASSFSLLNVRALSMQGNIEA